LTTKGRRATLESEASFEPDVGQIKFMSGKKQRNSEPSFAATRMTKTAGAAVPGSPEQVWVNPLTLRRQIKTGENTDEIAKLEV
jgi:hypothetical protein